MTYPPELQAYYGAHDRMMDAERSELMLGGGSHSATWASATWSLCYGDYKIARYNAVQAGYLPETPEFG
jgi:hypothetical protein